jgi:outer membrane receptor protein involved in Fe transport
MRAIGFHFGAGRKAALAAGVCLAGLIGAGSALAADSSSDQKANQVQEVVVTARYKPEPLQSVPLSITAFSGDELEARGAQGFDDYLRSVPGLDYNDLGANHINLVIRGLSPVSGNAAPVGLYLDGVAIPFFGNNPDFATFDVKDIEVLKGPQGTLYGEGALGGAILITTNKPDPTAFSAKVEATGSTTEHGGANGSVYGMINIPFAAQNMAVRITAGDRDDSGFLDNINSGVNGYNHVNVYSSRVALGYQPNAAWDVQAIVNYQGTHAGGEDFALKGDLTKSFASVNTDEWQNNVQYTLLSNYTMSNGKFETAFGYNHTKDYWNYDSTAFIGIPDVPMIYRSVRDVASAEARYLSNYSGPFNFVIGAYYRYRKFDNGIFFPAGIALFGIPAPYNTEGDFIYKNYAVYGEGYYTFFDKWKLTLGLRAFEEDTSTPATTTFGPFVSHTNGSANYKSLTPKFGLSYQATDTLMFFADGSEGYRSGGTNPLPFPDPAFRPTYDPDYAWSYEAGMKSEWFDRRLLLNATAFYIKWSHLQINGIPSNPSLGFTTNAGQAHSEGVELETRARVTNELTLSLGASYMDARLDEMAQGAPAGTTVSADYRHPLSGDLYGIARVDWTYRGKANYSLPPTPDAETPESDNLNMRLGVEKGRFSVIAFGNNLTNDHLISAAAGPYDIVGRPRTIGVTVKAGF